MTPSIYQQAIFDFITHQTGSLIIEAVAGSGKTTTIVKATELIPATKSVLFLAFNKSIAEELKKRCPRHVQCMTLNSLGHRAVMGALGRVNLDSRKTSTIINAMVDQRRMGEDEARAYGANIRKLVDLAKSVGIVPASLADRCSPLMADTDENWAALIAHHDIQIGGPTDSGQARSLEQFKIINYVREVLARGIEDTTTIDFNDQLYLPVIMNLGVSTHDFVFVDEAQDVSAIQRALLFKAMRKGSRLVAVGDPHQAIYGFRGADSDSLDNISRVFNCTRLPLSVSYRCSRAVIQQAQGIVPHIQSHGSAPMGSVTGAGTYNPSMFKRGDMVVCRSTAPVVKLAYALIAAKIPAKVMGRDMGSGLVTLIKKLNASNIQQLSVKLDDWHGKEIARLLSKDPESDLSVVEDKYACINTFIEGSSAPTVQALIQAIESLFSQETVSPEHVVTLSTIHKAKGLEADRVFFLDAWLLPSKYAKREHQKRQEQNLIYVAITRAKTDLVYIDSPRNS